MIQMALKRSEQAEGSCLHNSTPRWLRDGMLLLMVVVSIAVPHISQATELTAFGTRSQIVFSLLLAAAALFVQRRSQMLIPRRSKAGGSKQIEPLDAALRQYVPGVVTRHIKSGGELASCEREISVLFADIRGFTSLCEPRTPAEIFGMVNRFTERLCGIISNHGGHVIQFNGDGVMAVFGAPNPIVGKERAAVRAGYAILEATKSMSIDSVNPTSHLKVGVGIATGTDFVGNIQADRAIWTTVGNTTNLASRLQNLTRDLHVAMAIDDATRVALKSSAMNFERRRVTIRGRRVAQDVHVLRQSLEVAETALPIPPESRPMGVPWSRCLERMLTASEPRYHRSGSTLNSAMAS